MKFKLIFAIISLIQINLHSSSVFADDDTNGSLSCTYMRGWLSSDYYCILEIDNANSLETDFIDGNHYRNYNDSIVDTVYGVAARDGSAKSVPSVVCQQFINLRDLWLDHLAIEIVTDKNFRDCANLVSLYLGYNEISEVIDDSFEGNLRLNLLDLGHNKLATLGGGIFGNLVNLQHLFLDHNEIKFLHTNWFTSLTSLIELNLSKNEIFELQRGIFASLASLQLLDVSENHLTVIQSNSFGDFLSNLKYINLNHNEITAIDAKLINNANALETLNLAGNLCIDKDYENFNVDNVLELSDCFDNFNDAALTCTYMPSSYSTISYTCLLDIKNPTGRDDFVFIEGTHHESYTNASVSSVYGGASKENDAKNVPSIICAQFTSLIELFLDGLGIEIVTERSFEGCETLEALYLSDNKISALPVDAFASNGLLKLLDLGANHLTTLSSGLFRHLVSLEELYLDDNVNIHIGNELFDGLSKLKSLWLSNCGIASLEYSWMDSLSDLEVLHLDNNKILSLDRFIFAVNPNLRVLRLDNNQLTTLNSNIFLSQMNQFNELYANDNQLTSIAPGLLLETLKIVELSGNVCIDEKFENFNENRAENLEKFSTCFAPFINETTTTIVIDTTTPDTTTTTTVEAENVTTTTVIIDTTTPDSASSIGFVKILIIFSVLMKILM